MEDNTIDSFSIKKVLNFKAPGPQLNDVTFGAFILGETYYQNYVEKGKRDDLNHFIVCFYNEGIGSNKALIDLHAGLIKLVRIRTRETIAINYGLIREWLKNEYPFVFRLEEEIQRIEKSKQGFGRVLDLFEDYDRIKREKIVHSPMNLVLSNLNSIIKAVYSDPSKLNLLLGTLSGPKQS